MKNYGRWAVVTGASSGIGRACALALARRGYDLVAVARRADLLDELAAEARRFGRETIALALDLAEPSATTVLGERTAALDVGVFVAAAGFGTSGAFLDADVAAETEMIAVNCTAVVAQTLTFARRFAQRRRGAIVLFGSLLGFQGTPYAANYAATKAYVQTLAEALRIELRPHGVDVISGAPGPVRSGFEARANMRLGAAVEPPVVAEATLRALGRRTTVAPGALSKLLTWSLAPLGRAQRARIMGRVMAGITAHQRSDASETAPAR